MAIPGCFQCKRRNEECPGYDKTLRFRNKTPREMSQMLERGVVAPPEPSTTDSERVAYDLIATMDPSLPAGWRINSMAFVFQLLPPYLGRDKVLDDATSCLLTLHHESLSGNSTTTESARNEYVRALQGVQSRLGNENYQTKTETICAIVILTFCEYYFGSNDNGLTAHINGLVTLIQMRGFESFTTDFERAVFSAHMSQIFFESFRSGIRRCYYIDPAFNYFEKFTNGPAFRHWKRILCVLVQTSNLATRLREAWNSAECLSKIEEQRQFAVDWYNSILLGNESSLAILDDSSASQQQQQQQEFRQIVPGIPLHTDYYCSTTISMFWDLLLFVDFTILKLKPEHTAIRDEIAEITRHYYTAYLLGAGTSPNSSPKYMPWLRSTD